MSAAPRPVRRPGRERIQDLAEAVLAGGEAEEVLDLLLGAVHRDLGVPAVLVTPDGSGAWAVELVAGEGAGELLGATLAEGSALAEALRAGDPAAIESAARVHLADDPGTGRPALVAVVDTGAPGDGALAVLGDPDGLGPEDRERIDALAGLTGLALRGPVAHGPADVDDERRRIARDLHDLAIQELFAVGMELETLSEALSANGEPPSNARIRSAVSTSVEGVENAVTQIRQIVQSLRRDRAEATLVERLRHEVGLATSGLGFVPGLRLPPRPAELDEELPAEIAEDVVAVVRECLANAARHAHASAVAVSISVFREGVDRVVQVNVSDNGRGIDPMVRRRSGLANMSSRARRHSGWVDAFSLDPGTMISWRVTLPPV